MSEAGFIVCFLGTLSFKWELVILIQNPRKRARSTGLLGGAVKRTAERNPSRSSCGHCANKTNQTLSDVEVRMVMQ